MLNAFAHLTDKREGTFSHARSHYFYYKQPKRVSEFFISKYLFFKNDFCAINPHFLNPISKMFCNFSLKLNMANLADTLVMYLQDFAASRLGFNY